MWILNCRLLARIARVNMVDSLMLLDYYKYCVIN